MSKASRVIYASSFVVAAAGFLIPFWPLSLVGIAIAALCGRYIFAVIVALLLDVAWGVPVGILHYLYFPFTIFAIVISLVYRVSAQYFLDRSSPDTL